MIVAVEGADNSGKTVLSEELAKVFEWPRIHSGGPPTSVHDRNVKMADQLIKCVKCEIKNILFPIIYDRVTCISDPVYKFNIDDQVCASFRGTMLKYGMIVIFCRPPDEILMNVTNHPLKPHDTPEQVKLVKENQLTFVNDYDTIMKKVTHRRYDYTRDSLSALIDFIKGV